MATCYSLANSTVLSSVTGQQRCGSSSTGALFCCHSEDTCLEDSICHSSTSGTGSSGFYFGACTDPGFPAPCSKKCTDMQTQDVILKYPATSLWACCYQHLGANLDCSNPGNETFYAAPPQSLTTQGPTNSATSASTASSGFSSSTLISSITTSSISSTSMPSPSAFGTPSATPTHAPSNSLSAGAKAGIGVPVSIVGLGIIFALAFFLWKRPRRQKIPVEDRKELASSPSMRQGQTSELNAEQQTELDGRARSELKAS